MGLTGKYQSLLFNFSLQDSHLTIFQAMQVDHMLHKKEIMNRFCSNWAAAWKLMAQALLDKTDTLIFCMAFTDWLLI